MLKQSSHDFRILFLLKFTEELIRHSQGEVFLLEKTLDKEKKELKKELKENLSVLKKSEKFEKKLDDDRKLLENPFLDKKPLLKKPMQRQLPPPPRRIAGKMLPKPVPAILRVPEPRLPERLQYLRPTPTNKNIDLGKLNPLIKDPMVRMIQCDGPDKNIFVEGSMGRKQTGIVLSKDEIDNVLGSFSNEAKIPINDGSNRIVVGNLILFAVTSDVVSTKFVIKKMTNRGSMLIR